MLSSFWTVWCAVTMTPSAAQTIPVADRRDRASTRTMLGLAAVTVWARASDKFCKASVIVQPLSILDCRFWILDYLTGDRRRETGVAVAGLLSLVIASRFAVVYHFSGVGASTIWGGTNLEKWLVSILDFGLRGRPKSKI